MKVGAAQQPWTGGLGEGRREERRLHLREVQRGEPRGDGAAAGSGGTWQQDSGAPRGRVLLRGTPVKQGNEAVAPLRVMNLTGGTTRVRPDPGGGLRGNLALASAGTQGLSEGDWERETRERRGSGKSLEEEGDRAGLSLVRCMRDWVAADGNERGGGVERLGLGGLGGLARELA